jgi:excinuclease ABC subunit B
LGFVRVKIKSKLKIITMAKFKISSSYKPTGDQPQAIEKLVRGINAGEKHQVLLGVTGSGKTFSMANVIEKTQRPTLIISHNKTLAGQLAQEFRSLFPDNAVEYFVSYYDYYQPEAYIPSSDTYIEKETDINEEIEKLRLSATTSLMTRRDVIVVASVSAIYNLGSPKEYGGAILDLKNGVKVGFESVLKMLTKMFYSRNDIDFKRGTYRVTGDTIDIFPAYSDQALRVQFLGDKIEKVAHLDPLTGDSIPTPQTVTIYPAKHYITPEQRIKPGIAQIEEDLDIRLKELKMQNKLLEAQRLEQRTFYDLEMIKEFGYCNGIENYSRYFDGREPGEAPNSLMEFFPKDYLVIIDESHISLPQIRGMYNGDQARKQTLVEFGFRLPSALDNRPLKYEEFTRRVQQAIYVSATPDDYELSLAGGRAAYTKTEKREMERIRIKQEKAEGIIPEENPPEADFSVNLDDEVIDLDSLPNVAQQLIRPTGIIDPEIEVRPTEGQIADVEKEVKIRVSKGERVLITTLTKRMAEDLSDYLLEKGIKVNYLHSDIETLKRSDILESLRLGEYDVIVGINLLREGLDLPEVSLVVILDADKEGFLRSRTSLIQTMGRAARHVEGKVIMYADNMTKSMKAAIEEVARRREYQAKYNEEHNIKPRSIQKELRDRLIEKVEELEEEAGGKALTVDMIPEKDKLKMVDLLTRQMQEAAGMLDFEEAARLRDQIKELSS